MARQEFSQGTKVAAFKRANGRCEGEVNGERCGAFLTPGKYHYDHDNPDGLTGEPTLENCKVLCLGCHRKKTSEIDIPRIAKAKRREAKHIGAKAPSRRPLTDPRWKKKVSGEVVPR